jgi:hypothetical protein
MSSGKVTNVLTIRISDDDLRALERLCSRMPVVQRARLAREAFRRGVAQLEADPGLLVGQAAEPAKGGASGR